MSKIVYMALWLVSMGFYLPRVPILTTGWSASATTWIEKRELTGAFTRLVGLGSTAVKADERDRIPRAEIGEIERMDAVVDMVVPANSSPVCLT